MRCEHAHGSFYAWNMCVFIGKFSDMGLPDAMGLIIIAAAVAGVILGFIIEQGILKYMYHRDEVLIVWLVGLFLVLEALF